MNSVYLITNSANGKRYVGKTEKTMEERYYEHLREASRGSDRRLYQAIRKHGAQFFTISLLEECSSDTASAIEMKWIANLKTRVYQHGYNMTDGGEGKPGALITAETREKIGRSSRARVAAMSEDERRAMTAAANEKKRGSKERRAGKKEAQLKRWASTSSQDRAIHGAKCAAGISVGGRQRQVQGMNSSFSPVRVKGVKQPVSECPHCHKIGGRSIMGRYHFERCKFK
jgi:group I intron endonuclease